MDLKTGLNIIRDYFKNTPKKQIEDDLLAAGFREEDIRPNVIIKGTVKYSPKNLYKVKEQ